MAEPEGTIDGKKINGNTEIKINVKFLSIIIGVLISIGSTVFGIVNSKLNDANDNINALEQKVDGFNTTVSAVQAQNAIIFQHYGIDVQVEAETDALARRNDNDGRPGSLNGN